MLQVKFRVDEAQAQFLNNFKVYGFKDKNSMLREAIELFKKELELESLRKSAESYSEICPSPANGLSKKIGSRLFADTSNRSSS